MLPLFVRAKLEINKLKGFKEFITQKAKRTTRARAISSYAMAITVEVRLDCLNPDIKQLAVLEM